jgi:ParB family transcriptional regulator, chromosome partitioning protein
MKLEIESILPNPEQPRKSFDQADLDGLAQSIKEQGLITPITVEGPYFEGTPHPSPLPAGEGAYYILIAGERRLRAHKLLGLTEIEANIEPPRVDGTLDRLMRALVENIQRSGMDPIDEALAFQRLREEFGLSVADISERFGLSVA